MLKECSRCYVCVEILFLDLYLFGQYSDQGIRLMEDFLCFGGIYLAFNEERIICLLKVAVEVGC